MYYLGLLTYLALIFINLWGITLIAGVFIKQRWLAVAAGPWLVGMVMFGFECYRGLGPDLRGLAILGTVVSVGLVIVSAGNWVPSKASEAVRGRLAEWRKEFSPGAMVWCGVAFCILFGYALAWRMVHPEIDGSSEKIPDLAYICGYLRGETLPMTDAWLHPFKATQYYSFQHYMAGLMGRALGTSPGVTYNLAFCCLCGLTAMAFTGAVVYMTKKWWVRIVLVAAYVVGGTGATMLTHLTYKDPQPWFVMRFIGSKAYDKDMTVGDMLTTQTREKLEGKLGGLLQTRVGVGDHLQAYADSMKKMELPCEPYSYNVFLGDYHAPLAGFYLLGLGGLAMAVWERNRSRGAALVAGATLTWTVLSHTWVMPLQAMALGFWGLMNWREWRRLWPVVMVGFAGAWLAAWTFLGEFCLATADYKTGMKLVPWAEHTPIGLYVLFWGPTLALMFLSLYTNNRGRILGGLVFLFLLFAEFFYMDDIYVGEFNRFNTTLKWWSWIQCGALLALGPVVLEYAPRRWIRVCGFLACLYPCVYGVELGLFFGRANFDLWGKLEGHNYLVKNEGVGGLIDRLKREPKGVVLERLNKDSFTSSASLPLFAGHRMWLGWAGHELLWRGYAGFITQRQEKAAKFFAGELTGTGEWLAMEGIDYVLWYQPEDSNELWDKLDADMATHYDWCLVYTLPDARKIGFWRRKH